MNKRLAYGAIRVGVCMAMSALLFAAGCSKQMGEVSGTVNYRGEPLPGGNVTFFGKDNKILGTAAITNGKFKKLKLPPGAATITVTSAPPPSKSKTDAVEAPGKAPPTKIVEIPTKYGNPEKSGLSIKVKVGPQKHPIELD